MPLPVVSLEPPKAITPDKVPEDCLDCQWIEHETKLRDEWQILLHERYSYGQEVYKLLNQWTSKDYQEVYRDVTEDDGSEGSDEGDEEDDEGDEEDDKGDDGDEEDEDEESGEESEAGEEQEDNEQTSAAARIMQGKQFATPNYFKVEPSREVLLHPR
jgi:hypothetical protein